MFRKANSETVLLALVRASDSKRSRRYDLFFGRIPDPIQVISETIGASVRDEEYRVQLHRVFQFSSQFSRSS
ncbi:hypothetical protein ACHQM5_014813 [Ranunculus cassubicifolius]